MKPIKYYIQKLFGIWLYEPIIPQDKTTGFSLVRSERNNSTFGKEAYAVSPYYLQDVQMGDYSYFAKNAQVANTTIGKFCSIGPNFCCGLGIHPIDGISTHPKFYKDKAAEFKHTTIGNDVYIGANVTILDGVTIGDGAVIGAGAVVSKDIPPYAIAIGCPIEIKRFRFNKDEIAKLEQLKWWNGDDEMIEDIKKHEFNAREYLADIK